MAARLAHDNALRKRGADDHAASAGSDAGLFRELLERELPGEIVGRNERADQLEGRIGIGATHRRSTRRIVAPLTVGRALPSAQGARTLFPN